MRTTTAPASNGKIHSKGERRFKPDPQTTVEVIPDQIDMTEDEVRMILKMRKAQEEKVAAQSIIEWEAGEALQGSFAHLQAKAAGLEAFFEVFSLAESLRWNPDERERQNLCYFLRHSMRGIHSDIERVSQAIMRNECPPNLLA